MKNLIAFLAFVMMSQVYAQTPAQVQVLPASAQAKKTLIYDERTNQLVEVAPQVQPAPVPVQAEVATAPTAQPIYILNNQKLQGYQGVVQDAPTTVVQESPTKVSPSETIRKERQGAELATEDGIVQTLEKARLDDEVRRREKFNSALNSTAPTASGTTQSAAPQVVAAPAASVSIEENEVIDVAPAKSKKESRRKKVVLEDETSDGSQDVKAEVRAALAEQQLAPLNQTQYYVSGLVGTQSYDSANVHGKLASGFSLGMVTADRFVAEGSFIFAQNEVDDVAGPYATYQQLNMNQYSFSAAAKYQLLPGKLRPTVGVVGTYARRTYSFANSSYYGSSDSTIATTDAFDAGLEGGLDFALTNNFSIGADFRYLWNIASKSSNSSSRSYVNGPGSYNSNVRYVEDLSYYIAGVSAKFSF